MNTRFSLPQTPKMSHWVYPGLDICSTPMQLINVICAVTGVSYEELTKGNRKQAFVDARYLTAYFLYTNFKKTHSLQSLANMLNFESHASILHCLKRTNDLIESDKDFMLLFEKVNNRVNNCA